MVRLGGSVSLVLLVAGCAHPTPAPAVVVVTQTEDDAPRFYRMPSSFRDHDVLCEDVNLPGTCATIADVRIFLRSRKAD